MEPITVTKIFSGWTKSAFGPPYAVSKDELILWLILVQNKRIKRV